MTDTTQADEGTEFVIPIVKAGKAAFITINTKDVPDDVYNEAFSLGMKALLNRGMSQVTKETYPKEEERQAKAMEVANSNLEKIKTSKIRFTGGKKKVATGAIMTEARRLARNYVKDEIKRQGEKVSHYKAAVITEAANQLLETNPEIVEQAKKNVEERQKTQSSGISAIVKAIAVSPELVAKAEDKKLKSKAAGLSAKQAGKVEVRSRPQA
jgi:hypothetical protein